MDCFQGSGAVIGAVLMSSLDLAIILWPFWFAGALKYAHLIRSLAAAVHIPCYSLSRYAQSHFQVGRIFFRGLDFTECLFQVIS